MQNYLHSPTVSCTWHHTLCFGVHYPCARNRVLAYIFQRHFVKNVNSLKPHLNITVLLRSIHNRSLKENLTQKDVEWICAATVQFLRYKTITYTKSVLMNPGFIQKRSVMIEQRKLTKERRPNARYSRENMHGPRCSPTPRPKGLDKAGVRLEGRSYLPPTSSGGGG